MSLLKERRRMQQAEEQLWNDRIREIDQDLKEAGKGFHDGYTGTIGRFHNFVLE